jgi:hypothetical protein
MNEQDANSWQKLQQKSLSRRNLIRGAAGTALGAGLLRPKLAVASDDDDDAEHAKCVGPKPIPGGVVGLKPFGIFIHHNPLNPANAIADIGDPSQITDFDGFVGLTHIRGGGMGTDTATGATTRLAFQGDMGFSQGKFIVRTVDSIEALSRVFHLTCTLIPLGWPTSLNKSMTTMCMSTETTFSG